MKIMAMVPTYNERENIEKLIDAILGHGENYSVMVVDDLSPDGTGGLVDRKAEEYPGRVDAFHRDGPRGRGSAGIAGFMRAAEKKDIDVVVEMDADFSHDPKDLPRFLEAIADCDIVIGSRYVKGGKVEGWGMNRVINSFLANKLTQLILGLWRYKDCTSGYRAFRREVLEKLNWKHMFSTNPSIVEEILYACHKRKFRIREIPITFVDRTRGKSKISLGIIAKCFLNLFRIRFRGSA